MSEDTQAEQLVSPAVVEETMVQKALNEDPSGTPADKAAAFFKKSAHDLEVLLDNMSLRGIKRMVMNVATYPFLDREYTVKTGSDEYRATYRFNEMVHYKTIMQLQHEVEKAEQAINDGKDKEQLSLNKGEQNGNAPEETLKTE